MQIQYKIKAKIKLWLAITRAMQIFKKTVMIFWAKRSVHRTWTTHTGSDLDLSHVWWFKVRSRHIKIIKNTKRSMTLTVKSLRPVSMRLWHKRQTHWDRKNWAVLRHKKHILKYWISPIMRLHLQALIPFAATRTWHPQNLRCLNVFNPLLQSDLHLNPAAWLGFVRECVHAFLGHGKLAPLYDLGFADDPVHSSPYARMKDQAYQSLHQ